MRQPMTGIDRFEGKKGNCRASRIEELKAHEGERLSGKRIACIHVERESQREEKRKKRK